MTQRTTTSTPTVGTVIRAWRVFRGLSSKALAEKAGVRSGYLSEIENEKKRNPWLGHLEKLAVALEISLQDIQDRRLPPGQGEEDDQAGGQGPFPCMAQSPQPQATAAVGSVLQQLLEQVQALTAAITYLQADVTDLKQRVASLSPTPAGLAGDDALPYPFIGDWQGYARQRLPGGTTIPFVVKLGTELVAKAPHEMNVSIAWLLTLESIGDAQLSGRGLLEFDCRQLGDAFITRMAVDITGAVDRAGQIRLELQNIGDPHPLVQLTGRLTDDGWGLRGSYHDLWLAKDQNIVGDFVLQKASARHRWGWFSHEQEGAGFGSI